MRAAASDLSPAMQVHRDTTWVTPVSAAWKAKGRNKSVPLL